MQTEIVVGDIHGCFEEFKTMVGEIDHRYADANIILTGDLVDRGPRARDVLDFAMELTRAGRLSSVLGNHEEMFLTVFFLFKPDLCAEAGIEPEVVERINRTSFRFGKKPVLENWLFQGGVETLRSFETDPFDPATWNRIPENYISYLYSLPLLIEGASCVVTHAAAGALSLEKGMMYEDPWEIPSEIRNDILWSRHIPKKATHRIKTHVSGHTPLTEPLLIPDRRLALIDTGCVFGNALTALNPVDYTITQVPCQQ